MINITKHGMERYVERIKEIPKEEVKSYITLNRDMLQSELDKMHTYSDFIYRTKFENHNDCNYYLADDMILVLDNTKTKLITIYRADYGWDKDINKQIIERSLSHLEKAEEDYVKAIEEIDSEKLDLDIRAENLKEKIKNYENLIKDLKVELEGIKAHSKSIKVAETEAKAEKDEIARKIIYSIDYKRAMEDIKNM